MTLRGQPKPLKWDLLELADAVEKELQAASLRVGLWLLWLGVAQTVWPLLLKVKPRRIEGAE